MFGKYNDPNYDAGREERSSRLMKVGLVGLCICCFYSWIGGPLPTQVFQVWLATSALYGVEFYVLRGVSIREGRYWKAVSATLPLHCAYLVALFWLDRLIPQVMLKPLGFIPIMIFIAAVEAAAMSKIVDRYINHASIRIES
jgi:hypothetical protein